MADGDVGQRGDGLVDCGGGNVDDLEKRVRIGCFDAVDLLDLVSRFGVVVDHDQRHGVVCVILGAELGQQIDEPFGLVRLRGQDGRAQTVDEPQGRERMPQAQVLGVTVAFLDPVGGVLAEAGIHALGADQQLRPGVPVRHHHVDLLHVMLAEHTRTRTRHALHRAAQPSFDELTFAERKGVKQIRDGARHDAWFGGARPNGLWVEPGTAQLVGEPHVQRQGRHPGGRRRVEIQRDTEQPAQHPKIGRICQGAVGTHPRVGVHSAGSGVGHDPVEDCPSGGFRRRFSGHAVTLPPAGLPTNDALPVSNPDRRRWQAPRRRQRRPRGVHHGPAGRSPGGGLPGVPRRG